MTASIAVALLAAGVTACADGEPDSPPHVPARAESAAPADSLAIEIPGGGIWYAMPRVARAADGTTCVERTLEVRRGPDTIAVPLLYTRDIPSLVDDTTATARVFLDCAPGDRYRFDLRSGQPVRVK